MSCASPRTLEGPFNFNLGFYHNHDRNDAHYYVNADTLDYAAVVLGGETVANGFDLFPSQYDNDNNNYTLSSTRSSAKSTIRPFRTR